MDRPAPTTRDRILQAAYEMFYRNGFARVSVDAIAGRAGVTKRTVYYHFESKDQIAGAMMEVQHLHLMAQYRSWLGPSAVTAPDIVRSLFSRLKTWAEGPDWLGSGFSRMTAELADLGGHPARRAADRHKAEVETWLAERFAKVGVVEGDTLAREIMVLIEGSMSLALIHGDARYVDAAMHAAERLAATARARTPG
jgi:AcrR family transcriptional regulator